MRDTVMIRVSTSVPTEVEAKGLLCAQTFGCWYYYIYKTDRRVNLPHLRTGYISDIPFESFLALITTYGSFTFLNHRCHSTRLVVISIIHSPCFNFVVLQHSTEPPCQLLLLISSQSCQDVSSALSNPGSLERSVTFRDRCTCHPNTAGSQAR